MSATLAGHVEKAAPHRSIFSARTAKRLTHHHQKTHLSVISLTERLHCGIKYVRRASMVAFPVVLCMQVLRS